MQSYHEQEFQADKLVAELAGQRMWVDVSINDIRTCTHTCSLNVFEIDHLICQIEIELKE